MKKEKHIVVIPHISVILVNANVNSVQNPKTKVVANVIKNIILLLDLSCQ